MNAHDRASVRRRPPWHRLAALAALVSLLAVAGDTPAATANGPAAGPPVAISEFPLPAGSRPHGLTAGPDGALWFAMGGGRCEPGPGNRIGRLSPDGQLTTYVVPTEKSYPGSIAAGPDGALWFGERRGNKIGRLTVDGRFSEYPVPTAVTRTLPDGHVPGLTCSYTTSHPAEGGIAAGPDGALWFTEGFGSKIGRITTDGRLTEYPIPTADSNPIGIVAGPDGALWFVERTGNKIGRIATSGQIVEYPIPTPDSFPNSIVVGPDGALWFSELRGEKVGRITTAGRIAEYPLPAGTGPVGLDLGRDGALWIAGYNSKEILRMTAAGVVTDRYPVPWDRDRSNPLGLRAAPDGSLWFTDTEGSRIGRVAVGGGTAAPLQLPRTGGAPGLLLLAVAAALVAAGLGLRRRR